MAIFGRSNTNSDVPEDLQQYYNTGGTGVLTWVLRIVAGLVVLALLVWAGIGLAHKISNKSDNGGQTATTQQSGSSKSGNAGNSGSSSTPKQPTTSSNTGGSSTTTPSAPSNSGSTSSGSSSTTQNGSTGSTSTSGTTNGSMTTPQGSSTNGQQLANTGPGESLAAIFFGATALGAVAHWVVIRMRRQTR